MAKTKFGDNEIHRRYKQQLKTSIEEKLSIFAVENERKKRDFIVSYRHISLSQFGTIEKKKNILTKILIDLQEKANLHNDKIKKEIIESAKNRIYHEIQKSSSNLASSNLIDQFNKIKQDSLQKVCFLYLKLTFHFSMTECLLFHLFPV